MGSDVHPASVHPRGRTLGGLLRELTTGFHRLFTQEVDLARAELAEKVDIVKSAILLAGLGAAVLIGALVILLTAANRGLTVLLQTFLPIGTAVWLAPVVLAAVLFPVGIALVRKGMGMIQVEGVKPDETVDSMKVNKDWIQEKVS